MKSISTAATTDHRLTAQERAGLDADGFVVREQVFSAAEIADMAASCEALVDDLVRDRKGWRLRAGSYVFDPDLAHDAIIKWEGDTDVVHGIEPLAHLSPALHEWALDRRLVDPMVDLVGGTPLVGGPGGAKAPARMLFMNSDGELAMLSETADAARFQNELARLEAAISQPAMTMPRR